jgi:hypothetical protein
MSLTLVVPIPTPDPALASPPAEGLARTPASVLERRYLAELGAGRWALDDDPCDASRPILRELTALGPSESPGESVQRMAAVLSACHAPGQSFVMAVAGLPCEGGRPRPRLYFGGRRSAAGGAADEYLAAQAEALMAQFGGLELSAPAPVAPGGVADLYDFLWTAPALAAITGIPAPMPAAGTRAGPDWKGWSVRSGTGPTTDLSGCSGSATAAQ